MISAILTLSQAGRFNDVEAGYIRDWMIVAGCLGGLVLLVLTIVEKFKVKKSTGVTLSPDPLQVQEVEKLATKAEMMAMETRLSNKIAEVEGDMAEERKVARTANGTLHRRIDELVETLAETKGLLTGVKENTERLLNRQLK